MAGSPDVRLRLAARAENVLIARQALSGVADALGLDRIALNDISTAVTEACNNVVMHAYGDGEGPLEVELYVRAQGIDVVVGDEGRGIPPETGEPSEVAGGIGLPVIQALTESVDFRDLPAGGTEVRMSFEVQSLQAPAGNGAQQLSDGSEPVNIEPRPGSDDAPGEVVTMALSPGPIAHGVLPRVLSTLAARAHFTTDKLAETRHLAEELLADADEAALLSLSATVSPRLLDVRIGPVGGQVLDLRLAQLD
jgi:serine/threonine-protein kinase RsbW